MKHTILTVFTIITMAATTVCFASISSDYIVSAGIFGIDGDGDFYVKEQTRDIPLITKKTVPDFYFGVIVKSKAKKEFTCKATINVPTPDTVTLNEPDSIKPHKDVEFIKTEASNETVSTTTIQSDYVTCKNKFTINTNFNENDKPGIYSYKIYINNELLRTINFNVFETK